MTFWQTIGHNAIQALIAFDCFCNVLVCTLVRQEAWPNESLSSHAWRAKDTPMGKVFRPLIDVLFSWQTPDPNYTDASGQPIRGHCERAFAKEKAKFYLPPEYRA